MSDRGPAFEFFLGGYDLEMVTIAELLAARGVPVHDRQLTWGAKSSAYAEEIAASRANGRVPVLVELTDDLGLAEAITAGEVRLVDHHGDRAGADRPTALEQVLQMLGCPVEEWTRRYELVAANDRGHVRGMQAIDATKNEMESIRTADRAAQGITAAEEAAGRVAVQLREQVASGLLTVVRIPHPRGTSVVDLLEKDLGGPGYENLLILCPAQTLFYGSGHVIERLKSWFPNGWCGGALPNRGFWGIAQPLDELELIPLLEKAMTRSATEIEVRTFKHILLCPFLLRGKPKQRSEKDSQNNMLGPWVAKFTEEHIWQEQSETGVHERFSYNQIVYFHPFVRDFLFGDGDPDPANRSVRILTREDVQSVDVELGKWQPDGVRLRLDVARVELYLCKPCIAFLVLEVTRPRHLDSDGNERSDQPVRLAELQDLADQLRRLYPPFWWDEAENQLGACEPGLCLRSLTWRGATGGPIDVSAHMHSNDLLGTGPRYHLAAQKQEFDAFTRAGGEPPLFAHWQWFFGTMIQSAQKREHISQGQERTIDGLYVQQMLDERMPVMTYFGVENPAEVALGDRDRLTFVDASGTDPYPYDETFLAARRDRHTYSRFDHYHTHYFCSGYGFAMLGKADDFMYGTILQEHFSHHYFCLGLIAHYQRAALLYFADELASSIKDLAGKELGAELASPEFRKRVEEIQHRFIKFRSRTFFNEVTNQLQGRELFDLWFNVLETQKMFDLVDASSERMTSALVERESRQLARIVTDLSPYFIGLAVASTLFGAKAALEIKNWSTWTPDWTFWLIVAVSLLSGCLTWVVMKYVIKPQRVVGDVVGAWYRSM